LQLAEEEQKLKEIATFHANPPIVLSKPAFEPEHPARPPLEPVEIHLSTEQRALEREQFELHLKQKEMEEEAKRREVCFTIIMQIILHFLNYSRDQIEVFILTRSKKNKRNF